MLGVHVISPCVLRIGEVALHARDLACRVGEEGRDAIATLDVTAQRVDVQSRVARRAESLSRVALRGLQRGAAECGFLRGVQQRIGARHEVPLAEVPARGDLRLGGVPHVHHARVHVHVRVDVVVDETASGPALVRGLVVVQWTIVEEVLRSLKGPELVGPAVDRITQNWDPGEAVSEERAAGTVLRRRPGSSAHQMGRGVGVVAIDRAGAVIELALQRRTLVVIGDIRGRVALVVGKVRAHQNRRVLAEGGVSAPCWVWKLVCLDERVDASLVVVVVLVEVVARIHPHALEVRVENEVHHACDCVCTVHRRGTAGEDVHPLNEGCRNLIDVREVAPAER